MTRQPESRPAAPISSAQLLSDEYRPYAVLSEAAREFCLLKRSFFKVYRGSAHIQEVVPCGEYCSIRTDDVHRFAEANPIYHNRYDIEISGTRCTVYEGDINHYWIDSIKNAGSAQPFYPTWLFSAYMLALATKRSGCTQIVDVGSGDGRIAMCGLMLGMEVCSIELDGSLAYLQQDIAGKVGVALDVRHADAVTFDYAALGFGSAAVFTGGLPQMGDLLAEAVVRGVPATGNTRFILAGSHPRPGQGTISGRYGWGPLMDRLNLQSRWTMSLPTVWTFDQDRETPYMCVAAADT